MLPRSDEFEVQDHQRQKRHFSALSAACVRFVFGKTSLASSFAVFCHCTTIKQSKCAATAGIADRGVSSKLAKLTVATLAGRIQLSLTKVTRPTYFTLLWPAYGIGQAIILLLCGFFFYLLSLI